MIIYTLNKEYANMEKEEVMTKKEQIKSIVKVNFCWVKFVNSLYRVLRKYSNSKNLHFLQ